MIAEVLTESKAKNLDQTFSYLVPESMEQKLKVGCRVRVPFGRQTLEGFVTALLEEQNGTYELKEIETMIDEKPVLTEELLKLGDYMSKKTLSKKVFCYQTMLPTALKAREGFSVPKKYQTYLKINKVSGNETPLQKKILDLFQTRTCIEKKEACAISSSAVQTLLKKEVLIEFKEEVYRLQDEVETLEKPFPLTEEQEKVWEDVISHRSQFYPCLLHGVTGSGKTEVYMQWIGEVVKEGKEAIVLVPEISLTPQMVDHFKKRFGSDIAILHSRLSQGEKYDEWRKIENGEVHIVIGARSAIFAPFTNLGMIIIDEEHSMTYKQENHPKYHAIDIALKRGQYYQIPVILGSATPQIESYTRAKTGIYHLLEMHHRVSSNLPEVIRIDMRKEIKKGHSILSSALEDAIQDRLKKKEQTILLLNRRGYQTVISCHHCGFVHNCPNCDIPLTYHKTSHTMRCHYCGYGTRLLTECPVCHEHDINGRGLGTEKLVEMIEEHYPNARVIRMDIDTTTRKGSHEKIIRSFQNHEYDILIGTQMIAKGLDFPNVTLVGVINGDASLNLPDFRSAERTFQLLNQVAGRAGRAEKPGKVMIQAFNIDHYSIKTAAKHDYQAFYQQEMSLRKKLGYPPYQNLALIKMTGKDEKEVWKEITKIAKYLRKENEKDQIILGPNASSMPKVNQIYSVQIMIKYKHTKPLLQMCHFLIDLYQPHRKVNLDIDLSPMRL